MWNCPDGELYWLGIVMMRNCTEWGIVTMGGIVQMGNCPDGELY